MRLIIPSLLCLLLLFCSTASASPSILVLPGGGWQHADPATMQPWINDFHAHGMHARALSYPLYDIYAAEMYIKNIAKKEPKPVILYGISAGGTIAAALAATGDVDGAVNIAGPSDLTRWVTPGGLYIMHQLHINRAGQIVASPFWRLNGLQTPQLIQCGVFDTIVTYDQCERYYNATREVQKDTYIQPMVNGHSQTFIDRDFARNWIISHWGV